MESVLKGFDISAQRPSIIKVIGVGGGGGNAVNHMFNEGIKDVTFAICNTDYQALIGNSVPVKLQLGEKITKGLGAGNRPEIGKKAAEENIEDLQKLLSDGTEMVFITAGMGGGTGTGSAPVVAKIAKEMGVLTVGIVTIPFKFEGKDKILQALRGVLEIRKNVDALLVINNEKLIEIYGDMDLPEGLKKADDTLTTAAKSIAEIITRAGYINLDFADVHTTLKEGGVAIMNSGFGEGEGRISAAFENALNSPLLNNNDVFNAKKILFNIYFDSTKPLKMSEMNETYEFMKKFKDKEIALIWGTAIDNSLGEKVKVTVLASGFGIYNLPMISEVIEPDEIDKIKLQKEKEEKEAEEKNLIETYYGKEVVIDILGKYRPKPFIFRSIEQMDDNETIEALIIHPTYNRNSKVMLDIIKKAEARKNADSENVEENKNK
jgi:cell division protein FtsZ